MALSGAERVRIHRQRKRQKALANVPAPTRQQRSDSASAMVSALAAANKDALAPPSFIVLPDDAMPYWYGIIQSRPRDLWTDAELVAAAQLAECQLDLAYEERALRREGTIMIGANGGSVKNPRVDVVNIMAKRTMDLMRLLRMGGKAAGDPRALKNGALLEGTARQVNESADSDDLLA